MGKTAKNWMKITKSTTQLGTWEFKPILGVVGIPPLGETLVYLVKYPAEGGYIFKEKEGNAFFY